MKRNVTLKIIGAGYHNYYQPIIEIYNNKKQMIFKQKSYNGTLQICLTTNNYYYIQAITNGEMIKTVIYINDYQSCYYITFNHIIINHNISLPRIITLFLTDINYSNLPIKKGKVILWQKQ